MSLKDIQKQKSLLNMRDRHSMDWAILMAIVLHIVILYLPPVAHLDSQRVWEKPEKDVTRIFFYNPPPPPPEKPPETKTVKPKVYVKPIPSYEPIDPGNMVIDTSFEPYFNIDDIPIEPPQPLPEEPLVMGGDVLSPRVIRRVEPVYPAPARKLGIQGSVIVEAIISRNGQVRDVKIAKSLNSYCDNAAMDAVRQWQFEPGTQNDVPVDVIMYLTIFFKLN